MKCYSIKLKFDYKIKIFTKKQTILFYSVKK